MAVCPGFIVGKQEPNKNSDLELMLRTGTPRLNRRISNMYQIT